MLSLRKKASEVNILCIFATLRYTITLHGKNKLIRLAAFSAHTDAESIL